MRRAVTLAVVLALATTGLAACSDDAPAAKKGAQATIDPDVRVRFPRYWATTDEAESGADDASNAKYFVGVDGKRLVYNAEDVVRVIDRETGKQIKQSLIAQREVICAFPPDRTIDDHILVLATARAGADGDQDCQTVRGYDVEKGAFVWATKFKYPSRLTLDSRDDSVLVTAEVQDPRDYQITYGMSSLDLRTGKLRWTKTALQAFADKPGKDLEDCTLRAAVAADEPVVVGMAGCNDYSSSDDLPPNVVGFDLKSGKRLWTQPATWLGLDEDGAGSAEYFEPHPNDGAYFPATRDSKAGYVDLKTGKGRTLPTPKATVYKKNDEPTYFTPCDDLSNNGNQITDQCVYPVVDHTLLYVWNDSSASKTTGSVLHMLGADARTGKKRFEVTQLTPKPKKDEYVDGSTFLGIDDRREEFWFATDKEHVERYSVKTGKRVGRGELGPPLGLTKIAAMGPGYLAVRGDGGITGPSRDVLSGMDYYRTNTK